MLTEAEEFDRLIGDQWVTLGQSFTQLHDKGDITLSIDGESVTINRIITGYKADDRFVPARLSTIYDAVNKLRLQKAGAPGDTAPEENAEGTGAERPVPVLCHREHMRPAAVCRVCLVEVKGFPRLVAACHQPVEPGMVVQTIAKSARVQRAVKTVTELLLSDHQTPPGDDKLRDFAKDELAALRDRLKTREKLDVSASRFSPSGIDRGQDESSPVILVDHNACILCDRCIRACNDVKSNGVLSRMNKGFSARIAFDLNDPMGESSCVACGECMISCPTGALSNRQVINVEWDKPTSHFPPEPVSLAGLRLVALFADISPAFLAWNQSAIRRRRYRKGEVVCKQGDFGASAFIIEKGTFEVLVEPSQDKPKVEPPTAWGWFRRQPPVPATAGEGHASPRSDSPAVLKQVHGKWVSTLTADDVMFGEMACMSFYPRSATVVAASDDCEVLEVLRNVLYMLGRTQSSKEVLDRLYRQRAIDNHLQRVSLFAKLPDAVYKPVLDFLRERVKLVRVHKGQVIVRQGEKADHFDMIRIGFVKVSRPAPGRTDTVVNYLGPDEYFGEIGLLAQIPTTKQRLGLQDDLRTATITALDHVDVVRIDGQDFKLLVRAFLGESSILDEVAAEKQQAERQIADRAGEQKLTPDQAKPEQAAVAASFDRWHEVLQRLLNAVAAEDKSANVAERLVQTAGQRLAQNRAEIARLEGKPLDEYLRQGLMEATNLLVLDLEKCTRCDECVKACRDVHRRKDVNEYEVPGGLTRLIRDGLRFDKYLVASSCRACLDPYCMVGCPVGSIQRNTDGTVLIKDWCIGCGLCERNCPYGNINMHGTPDSTKKKAVAATCDNCADAGADPRCVYACPHDAAHRMTGSDLLLRIESANGSGA